MAANENNLLLSSGNDTPALVQPISTNYQISRYAASKITRHDFASDFIWGSATSAHQVEGAYAEGGKSMSNWDAYALRTPGKIMDGSNGCLAIDQYHKYQEDVLTIKKLGLDAYRFSIAWTRVLPGGRLSLGVNREGIKYYNDLINFCLAQGVEPYVTIFHWDVPQCLEDEYGGFLSPRILPDFVEFAELCFWEFGDRVKYWITINEPWSFAVNGYVEGSFPPGHGPTTPQPVKSRNLSHRGVTNAAQTITAGDPATEPYIVGHHLILAHALAVDVYRKNYQAVQGGKIGITNVSKWFDPLDEESQSDIDAALRAVDFMWGWFVAPIVNGEYPPIMRLLVKDRLPKFTDEQKTLITQSFDFMGFNYYTTNYASNLPTAPGTNVTYWTDQNLLISTEKDGMPIGPKGGSDWMYIVPHGIYRLLVYTKETYNDPPIYITENGVDEINDKSLSVTEARVDDVRIKYHQDHLAYVKKAIDQDGVNVKAYFLWSMFDNYEWAEGYTVRFGIFYVDYVDGLKRYPKKSAIWWMNFLNKNVIQGRKRQVEEIAEGEPAVKRLRSAEG